MNDRVTKDGFFDFGREIRQRLNPTGLLPEFGLNRCALLGITREGRRLPDIEHTGPDGIKVLLKDVVIRSTMQSNIVELTCRVSYELRNLPEKTVTIPLGKLPEEDEDGSTHKA